MAFVSASMFSCEAEDVPVELTLASGLYLDVAETRVQTNTTDQQDNAFVTGQSVDLFIYESGTKATTTKYGDKGKLIYTTAASNGLNPPNGAKQFWPSSGQGLKIFGYYPSGTVSSNSDTVFDPVTSQNFTVKSSQKLIADYRASDLMYGAANSGNEVARTTSAVTVTFKHLLSQVNVVLKYDATNGGTDANMLNGATVTIDGLDLTAVLNPKAGTVGSKSGGSSTVTVLTVAGTTDANRKGSAVVVPQTLTFASNNTTKSFITVTLSSTYGGGVLKYRPTSNITLESGKKYTYEITVRRTELKVTSSVTDWTNTTAVPGYAEF